MNPSRRDFVVTTSLLAVAGAAKAQSDQAKAPWYKRCHRWGQTNITEKDPVRYDIAWWRGFWKKTAVQAVIINAGGKLRRSSSDARSGDAVGFSRVAVFCA